MSNFEQLVRHLHEHLEQVPDHRRGGNNTRYEIKDAALGAFAAFFTQSPSFGSTTLNRGQDIWICFRCSEPVSMPILPEINLFFARKPELQTRFEHFAKGILPTTV